MLVPWRVADLLIQTIKQTIQTIPSLISSPVFPVSCTTPKWAFCARVLAESQKIWKTPSVHFILWNTFGEKNCGFITWLCVIPKKAKSTFNLPPSDSSKNQAIHSNYRFLLRLHPGSRIFHSSPKTQTSQANIQYQWRTHRTQHKSLEQFDLELQVNHRWLYQGFKGGRFQATPKCQAVWNWITRNPPRNRWIGKIFGKCWRMLSSHFWTSRFKRTPTTKSLQYGFFLKHCLWQVAPASSRETYCRKPDLWHLAGIFGFEDLKLFSCHISETLGQVSTGTLLWKPTRNHHRPSIFRCSIGANTWVLHLCSGIPDLEPIKTVFSAPSIQIDEVRLPVIFLAVISVRNAGFGDCFGQQLYKKRINFGGWQILKIYPTKKSNEIHKVYVQEDCPSQLPCWKGKTATTRTWINSELWTCVSGSKHRLKL